MYIYIAIGVLALVAANFAKIRAVIYDVVITSMTKEWYVNNCYIR